MIGYLGEVFPEAPEARQTDDPRGGFQELHRDKESAFNFDFNFDGLSPGAHERFAASPRISMAEVLTEAYEGCLPLLFDDAFTHSDPDRQGGIDRMLQRAADQAVHCD